VLGLSPRLFYTFNLEAITELRRQYRYTVLAFADLNMTVFWGAAP
jgi:hypothetical protein